MKKQSLIIAFLISATALGGLLYGIKIQSPVLSEIGAQSIKYITNSPEGDPSLVDKPSIIQTIPKGKEYIKSLKKSIERLNALLEQPNISSAQRSRIKKALEEAKQDLDKEKGEEEIKSQIRMLRTLLKYVRRLGLNNGYIKSLKERSKYLKEKLNTLNKEYIAKYGENKEITTQINNELDADYIKIAKTATEYDKILAIIRKLKNSSAEDIYIENFEENIKALVKKLKKQNGNTEEREKIKKEIAGMLEKRESMVDKKEVQKIFSKETIKQIKYLIGMMRSNTKNGNKEEEIKKQEDQLTNSQLDPLTPNIKEKIATKYSLEVDKNKNSTKNQTEKIKKSIKIIKKLDKKLSRDTERETHNSARKTRRGEGGKSEFKKPNEIIDQGNTSNFEISEKNTLFSMIENTTSTDGKINPCNNSSKITAQEQEKYELMKFELRELENEFDRINNAILINIFYEKGGKTKALMKKKEVSKKIKAVKEKITAFHKKHKKQLKCKKSSNKNAETTLITEFIGKPQYFLLRPKGYNSIDIDNLNNTVFLTQADEVKDSKLNKEGGKIDKKHINEEKHIYKVPKIFPKDFIKNVEKDINEDNSLSRYLISEIERINQMSEDILLENSTDFRREKFGTKAYRDYLQTENKKMATIAQKKYIKNQITYLNELFKLSKEYKKYINEEKSENCEKQILKVKSLIEKIKRKSDTIYSEHISKDIYINPVDFTGSYESIETIKEGIKKQKEYMKKTEQAKFKRRQKAGQAIETYKKKKIKEIKKLIESIKNCINGEKQPQQKAFIDSLTGATSNNIEKNEKGDLFYRAIYSKQKNKTIKYITGWGLAENEENIDNQVCDINQDNQSEEDRKKLKESIEMTLRKY